jgi:tripartite-type tricarboxylate transporter receptor subunit TctC
MKLPRRTFLHLTAGAAALPAVSRVARAQAYPTRPVRIVAPTAPGGAPDIVARLIGPWLSGRLGQQFVVENRPGGGSNIGTEAVVRAPPDGYTLLMVSTIQAINATLYSKLNFNFIRDIAPVAGIMVVPNVMVVNPSVPAQTVPEFIEPFGQHLDRRLHRYRGQARQGVGTRRDEIRATRCARRLPHRDRASSTYPPSRKRRCGLVTNWCGESIIAARKQINVAIGCHLD